MEDILDGGFDKIGLPQHRGDLHPCGQFWLEVVEDRFERAGERERVGAGLLLHPENDRGLRVDRALTPFGGRVHLHAPEVGNADRHAVLSGDHRCPDVLRRPHAAQAGDQVFRPADDHEARRDILVGGRERLRDLFQGDTVGAQLRGREQHLILFLTATDGDHLGHPWHGQEPAAQDGFGGGAKFDRTVPRGGQRQEEDLAHDRRDGRQHRAGVSGGRSPAISATFSLTICRAA